MSKTVDTRVVEMQFDNARFEQGVKTTLGSLSRLKQALNFPDSTKSFQGITRAANNVDLSNVESGISSLEKRFSTLGIAGMTVIQNVTNGFVGLVKKINSQIINGGITRAMNIEQAKFQIEGLAKDGYATWNNLQDAINNAVSGTAYGFDEAAKAASQFYASGIKDATQMEKALTGISGLAAMTGSSYGDIADIMTTVAGNGRLMSEQLRQFSSRGINVAAELGNQLGKTEAEIRDMVTKGQIDFQTFAFAMNDAFGKHATEADKTFTGAMANVKAALSRVGAAFVTPLIEINDFNDDIWNLVDIATSIKSVFNAVEKTITSNKKLMDTYGKIVATVSKNISEFLRSLVEFDENGKAVGFVNLAERFKLTETASKNLRDTFQGLKSFVQLITKAFTGLAKAVSPAGSTFSSFGSVLLAITGALGRFITAINNGISRSVVFKSIVAALTGVFRGLATIISSILSGISDTISSFGQTSKAEVEGIANNFIEGFNPLSKAQGKLSRLFSSIGDGITSGLSQIHETLNSSNLSELLNEGLLVTFAFYLNKIINSIRNLANSITMVGSVKETLASVRATLFQYQNTLKAEILQKIAISVALLAGSLALLASIDSDKLMTALLALAGVAVIFKTLVSGVVGMVEGIKAKDILKLQGLQMAMIGIATAMLILSAAVRILGTLKFTEIIKGLYAMQSLMMSLALFATAMSSIKGGLIKTSAGIIVLSTALLMLSASVKILGSMNIAALAKGLTGIGVLLAEVGGFMVAMKLFDASIGPRAAAGILILSVSLLTLSRALQEISSIGYKDLIKSLTAMGLVLVEIAFFMQSIDGIGKESNMLKSAVAIVAISTSLRILSDALSTIGGMSWIDLAKGLTGISAGLFIMAAAMKAISGGNVFAGAAGILAMAVALRVLTPVLTTLGSMSLKSIGKSLLALAGAFTVIGLAAAILAESGIVVAIAALGASILLLGAGMAAAGAGVMWFATGLTTLIGSLELILVSIPALVNTLIEAVKQFAIKIVSIYPELVQAGMQLLIQFLKGIRDSLPMIIEVTADIVIAFLNGLAQKLPEIIQAGVDFLAAFVQGIIQAIANLSNNLSEAGQLLSVETFHTIALSLLELSAAVAIFSRINAGAALSAVISLGTFAAGLTAVLSVLGKINSIPGVRELVKSGGRLLGSIGEAIGQLVGGLIGGIGEGITGTMPKMAKDLSNFMTSLQPFLDGVGSINGSIIEGVKNLADAMLALTQAKMIEGLSGQSFGTFKEFGEQISEFIPVFKKFSEEMGDLDPEIVENVRIITEVISTLAKAANEIPNQGGAIAAFTGDNQLSVFAEELTDFAREFSKMAVHLAGVNEDDIDKVKAVASAAKAMAKMAHEIPNEGGMVSAFTGDNSLTTFASEIVPFIEAFRLVSKRAEGIADDAPKKIKQVSKATKALVEVAKEIPNEGGWAGAIFGDNTLATFADELVPFIVSFKILADDAADISDESIQKVHLISGAAKSIVEVSEAIPKNTIFVEPKGLDDFAEELNPFTIAFKALADSAADISDESIVRITAISGAAKAMAEVSAALPKNGVWTSPKGLDEFADELNPFVTEFKKTAAIAVDINEDGVNKTIVITRAAKNLADVVSTIQDADPSILTKFGEELPKFSGYFVEFAGGVVSVDVSGVNKIMGVLPSLVKAVNGINAFDPGKMLAFGTNLPTLGEGIKMYAEHVSSVDTVNLAVAADSISRSIQKLQDTVKNYDLKSQLKSVGKDAMSGFTSGLSANASKPISIVTTTVQAASKVLTSSVTIFRLQGKNAANGYISGLTSLADKAKAAAATLGGRAASGGKSTYSLLRDGGAYVGQGFVDGILSKKTDAYNAGYELGKQSKKGQKDATKESSPAKEFIKGGKFAGEGYVIGLLAFTRKAYHAGYELGAQSLGGTNDALLGEFNNPVITPVLDLSQVASGANQIGTMLNNQTGLQLAGTIDGNTSFDADQSIIEAINRLNSKLDAINREAIDPDLVYEAVRVGASNAQVGVTLNNRELSRELRNMGVAFQ